MNNTQNLDPDYLVTSFPAETSISWNAYNWLLASAKPGHIEPRDQSAVKKTDNGYQGEGCPYWISSVLTVYASYRCCYFDCLFQWKIG